MLRRAACPPFAPGAALGILLLALCPAAAAVAAHPAAAMPVEELVLDNGMRFLFVPRAQGSMVAAGWVVEAGSAAEAPGKTGLAHLIEHLMFKGTRTVGARGGERERQVHAERDRLFAEMRGLEERGLAGRRARRHAELARRFADLGREARSLAFLGELTLHYSRAGAVGLNAHTAEDFTLYLVRLPAEALELWFWLESDRLLAPVLRDFHREKEIVAEERRLRIASTPTGRVDEAVLAHFWGEHPYARRPLGEPRDLVRLGRPDAASFLAAHYRPEKITVVLVGRFERSRAAELARRYFGRLRGAGPRRPAPQETLAAAPRPGGWRGSCDCPRQARVIYPTVPFRHPDSYPLEVLAALLSGRTGRLHRELVLGRELAFSASAEQRALARGGSFAFVAEARGAVPATELVAAWDVELARLVEAPVPAEELGRVRNRVAADALRRLRDPYDLLRQLLVYAGLGDWREVREGPERVLAVDGEAVRAAARRYLRPERRLVALIEREPGAPKGSP